MLGNMCMMTGHDAGPHAEPHAGPKNEKLFDFSIFLDFFQFLTYFSPKMGYFYGF